MATPEKLKIQHLTWDGDKDPQGSAADLLQFALQEHILQ